MFIIIKNNIQTTKNKNLKKGFRQNNCQLKVRFGYVLSTLSVRFEYFIGTFQVRYWYVSSARAFKYV